MKNVAMFLDDERQPGIALIVYDEVYTCRSSKEAIEWVYINGCPNHISFDHDLGVDDTTMKFLDWLIEQDMGADGRLIPEDFTFYVHSQNPVGAENIRCLLNNYLEYRK